jgi:hypothetical protein
VSCAFDDYDLNQASEIDAEVQANYLLGGKASASMQVREKQSRLQHRAMVVALHGTVANAAESVHAKLGEIAVHLNRMVGYPVEFI